MTIHKILVMVDGMGLEERAKLFGELMAAYCLVNVSSVGEVDTLCSKRIDECEEHRGEHFGDDDDDG